MRYTGCCLTTYDTVRKLWHESFKVYISRSNRATTAYAIQFNTQKILSICNDVIDFMFFVSSKFYQILRYFYARRYHNPT